MSSTEQLFSSDMQFGSAACTAENVCPERSLHSAVAQPVSSCRALTLDYAVL
jgi:hypothetical protein